MDSHYDEPYVGGAGWQVCRYYQYGPSGKTRHNRNSDDGDVPSFAGMAYEEAGILRAGLLQQVQNRCTSCT